MVSEDADMILFCNAEMRERFTKEKRTYSQGEEGLLKKRDEDASVEGQDGLGSRWPMIESTDHLRK
jgi:hypothetical protein